MSYHPIKPPPYKPSESEHRIAYLKWCLDRIVNDSLLGVDLARKGKLPVTNDAGERELSRLLKTLFEHEDADDRDSWEHLYDFEKFKKDHEEALADIHCGDCTAVARTCCRCLAEDLYEIQNTVSWKGKIEGWALLNEWREAKKPKGEKHD